MTLDEATRALEEVLGLGALCTLTVGRRTPQPGEQPYFVHAHIYEVRRPMGVCESGRHFMCQGDTLAEVLERTVAQIKG